MYVNAADSQFFYYIYTHPICFRLKQCHRVTEIQRIFSRWAPRSFADMHTYVYTVRTSENPNLSHHCLQS